ncbi:MAG: putative signal transducing protein [Nannocystales bacterium]
MTTSSQTDTFVLLQTCYDQATAMTVQSLLESERIEVVMKRIADRSIEGHARGPALEVRAMVHPSDLATARALLEAFESAEVVSTEVTEPDPNDRSLQQFRERMGPDDDD